MSFAAIPKFWETSFLPTLSAENQVKRLFSLLKRL
jgi:hypothetical protein